MQIEAGGKRWIVEEREIDGLASSESGRFYGLFFRNADYNSDVLQLRWLLRPERLTPRLAQELFTMAAIRLWRDPRDGRIYRLFLETRVPTSPAGRDSAIETVRFEAVRGTFEAPWNLAKPLGCAEDAELEQLLDLARSA